MWKQHVSYHVGAKKPRFSKYHVLHEANAKKPCFYQIGLSFYSERKAES